MLSVLRLGLVGAILTALSPSPVAAQSETGPRIGGFVSGAFGDGGPAPAIGISAGYAVTPSVEIEVNAAYVPGLDFGNVPVCPPGLFCVAATIRGGTYSVAGRARSASAAVVIDLPVRLAAMRPYFAGGVGLANLRRELRDTEFPFTLTRTSTDPLITVGGGLEMPLGRRLILSVDVRYEYIAADTQFDRADIDRGVNLTRIGSGLRYRF